MTKYRKNKNEIFLSQPDVRHCLTKYKPNQEEEIYMQGQELILVDRAISGDRKALEELLVGPSI